MKNKRRIMSLGILSVLLVSLLGIGGYLLNKTKSEQVPVEAAYTPFYYEPFRTMEEALAVSSHCGWSPTYPADRAWTSTVKGLPGDDTDANGNGVPDYQDINADLRVEFEPVGTVIVPDYWAEWGDVNSLRKYSVAGVGQHVYNRTMESGEQLPVAYWKNEHNGECVHGSPFGSPILGTDYYRGFPFTVAGLPRNGISPCGKLGDSSGWIPYCAYCGERVFIYHYATADAIRDINALEIESTFMYTCRLCFGFEQGHKEYHVCKSVSDNKYIIEYNINTKDPDASGPVVQQTFYYNGATEYENSPVKGAENVAGSVFLRPGYELKGWSYKEDGGVDVAFDTPVSEIQARMTETEINTNGYTITLFAVWEPLNSTLQVDAMGGTYKGDSVYEDTRTYQVLDKNDGHDYGLANDFTANSLKLDPSDVVPPEGHTIIFDGNGGTSAVSSMDCPQEFYMFFVPENGITNGSFGADSVYTWGPKGGITDRIEIQYKSGSVVLPDAERPNHVLVGWYTEPEGGEYRGQPGDTFTPPAGSGTITIYAHWETIKADVLPVYYRDHDIQDDEWNNIHRDADGHIANLLNGLNTPEDTLNVNSASGAFDLSYGLLSADDSTVLQPWMRLAGTNNWLPIIAGSDGAVITKEPVVFGHKDSEQTFTVTSSGYYSISALGGSGGDYTANSADDGADGNNHSGGKGGTVAGNIWLEKGDVLYIKTGGKGSTATGGGKGDKVSGGGFTIVELVKNGTDTRQTLLIAGGGGGAAAWADGGNGGLTTGLTGGTSTKGVSGQSGTFGGGGGYQAGKAGSVTPGSTVFKSGEHPSSITLRGKHWTAGYFCYPEGYSNINDVLTTIEGNQYLTVSGSDGKTYYIRYSDFESSMDFEYLGVSKSVYNIPSTSNGAWQNIDFNIKQVPGSDRFYLERNGRIVGHYFFLGNSAPSSATASYVPRFRMYAYATSDPVYVATSGGSNYVNSGLVSQTANSSSENKQSGSVTIEILNAGFSVTDNIYGVQAFDDAAPDPVTGLSFDGENLLWQEVTESNGTSYDITVGSYDRESLSGSGAAGWKTPQDGNPMVLIDKTVELKSAVAGYYYIIDDKPSTIISTPEKIRGTWTGNHSGAYSFVSFDDAGFNDAAKQMSVSIGTSKNIRYAHVACVDTAGNISQTRHLKIPATPGRLYSVFDPNGGTVPASGSGNGTYWKGGGEEPLYLYYTIDSKYGDLPVPNNTSAYTFGGWWSVKGQTGGIQATPDTVQSDSVATWYARWIPVPKECMLLFDYNLPEGSDALTLTGNDKSWAGIYNPGMLIKDRCSVLPEPSLKGCSFIGWYTDRVGGTPVTPETVYSWDYDKTVYARWEGPVSYKVVYHSNKPDGTDQTMSFTYGDGESAEIITFADVWSAPSHMHFENWATLKDIPTDEKEYVALDPRPRLFDGITGSDVIYFVDENIEPYLKATKTFGTGNRKGEPSEYTLDLYALYDTDPYTVHIDYNVPKGLFTEKKAELDCTGSNKDLIVYEKTVNRKDKTWAKSEFPTHKEFPANRDEYAGEYGFGYFETKYGESFVLPKPTMEGRDFLGWSLEKNGELLTPDDVEKMIYSDIGEGDNVTVYAIWNPHRYDLHFHYNKPDEATHDVEHEEPGYTKVSDDEITKNYEYEEKLDDFPDMSDGLTGWVFDDWYYGNEDGSEISDIPYTEEDFYTGYYTEGNDIHLWAKWRPATYTVHLMPNKPSVSTDVLGTSQPAGWDKGPDKDSFVFKASYDTPFEIVVPSDVYGLTGWSVSGTWFITGYKCTGDLMTEHAEDLYNMYTDASSRFYIGRSQHPGNTGCASCTHGGHGTAKWNLTAEDGGDVYLYPYYVPHTYDVSYSGEDARGGVYDRDRMQGSGTYAGTDVFTRRYAYDAADKYLKTPDRTAFSSETVKDGVKYTVGWPRSYSNYYHYSGADDRKLNGTENSAGASHTTAYDRRFTVTFKDSAGHCTEHTGDIQFSDLGRSGGYNLDNDIEVDYWEFIGWDMTSDGENLRTQEQTVSFPTMELRSDNSNAKLVPEDTQMGNLTSTDGAVVYMKAVWKDMGIKYPAAVKAIHSFTGWYTNPQVASRNAGTGRTDYGERGVYYGGGEQIWNYGTLSTGVLRNDGSRSISADTTVYAWWNSILSYIDVYDGIFYEGQDVSYNDLMRLIAVEDWEDDYVNTLIAKYDALLGELGITQTDLQAQIEDWEAAYEEYMQELDRLEAEREQREAEREAMLEDLDEEEDLDEDKYEDDDWDDYWDDDDVITLVQPDATVYDDLMEQSETVERLIAEINAELDALSDTESYIQGKNLVVQIKEIHYNVGDITVVNEDLFPDEAGVPDSTAEESKLTLEMREEAYKSLKLDTSSKLIDHTKADDEFEEAVVYSGGFQVTYTVTDNGINSKIEGEIELMGEDSVLHELDPSLYEPVTVDYVKACKLLYNDRPYLFVNDVLLMNNDPVLDTKESLFGYLTGNQIAIDLQDLKSNSIWWTDKGLESGKNVVEHDREVSGAAYDSKGWYQRYNIPVVKNEIQPGLWWDNWDTSMPAEKYTDGFAYPNINTRYHLQDRIHIKDARVVGVDVAFAQSHPDEAKYLFSLQGMDAIFGFNGQVKPADFKYITAVEIVYDTFDQWGKCASGGFTSYGDSKGLESIPSIDRPQTEEELTSVMYLIDKENDSTMIRNYVQSNLRYIDEEFMDSLGFGGFDEGSSYFATDAYGRMVLQKAFDIAKDPDKVSTGEYLTEYKDAKGRTVKVYITDYTD